MNATIIETQLRKAIGSQSSAVVYCLDCNWQDTLSMQAAWERIV